MGTNYYSKLIAFNTVKKRINYYLKLISFKFKLK